MFKACLGTAFGSAATDLGSAATDYLSL